VAEIGHSVLSIIGALVVFFVASFFVLKALDAMRLSGWSGVRRTGYAVPLLLYMGICVVLFGFLSNFLYGELRHLWGLFC